MAGRTIEFVFKGDARDLDRALAQVRGEADKTGKSLDGTGKKGAGGIGSILTSAKAGAAGLAVLAGGAVAAGAAAWKLGEAVISLSADLNDAAKSAKEVGTSVEDLDQTQGVFDLLTRGGVDAARAMQDFQRAMAEAKDGAGEQSDALDKLGLHAEDLINLPLPEALAKVSDRFGVLETDAERTQVAMAIFGRSGRHLVPALKEGGAAIEEAAEKIRESGLVSSEAAEKGEELQDALLLMKRTGASLKRDVLVPLIPALTDLAFFIRDALAAARESGLAEFAADLADVTSGAILATRALFGLDAAERQRRAASEEGQKAIREQADRIEILRRELLDWTNMESSNATALSARPAEIARITAEIERQVGVLRRLRGELAADIPGLLPTTGPQTGGGGAPPGGRGQGATTQVAVAQDEAEAVVAIEQSAADRRKQIREEALAWMADQERRLTEVVAENEEWQVFLEQDSAQRRSAIDSEFNHDSLSSAGALSDALISLSDMVMGNRVAATKAGTAEQKAALKEQFIAGRVAALAEIAVNTIIAASEAAASAAPPANIPAIAAAIAIGVAQGVAAAAVPPPSFHRGGMARDELLLRIRDGEQRGILSPQGVAAAGGESGVNRLNRGEGGNSGPMTVVVKVNNKTTDTQVYEAARRPDSTLSEALQSMQPRRIGSARVW